MDQVYVGDMNGMKWLPKASFYVALSRAKTLQDIFLEVPIKNPGKWAPYDRTKAKQVNKISPASFAPMDELRRLDALNDSTMAKVLYDSTRQV